MRYKISVIILLTCKLLNAHEVDLKSTKLYNETAYITSQCYTKTQDEYNPDILHIIIFSYVR